MPLRRACEAACCVLAEVAERSRGNAPRNCVKRGNVSRAGTGSDVAADSPVATGGAAAFVGARSTTPPCLGNPAGRRSASMPPRALACSVNRWSTTEHPRPGDRPGCRGWPFPARDPGSAGPAARLVSVVAKLTARSPRCRDLPFVVLPSCGRPSALAGDPPQTIAGSWSTTLVNLIQSPIMEIFTSYLKSGRKRA
jgi:hypothetical protein